MIFLVLIIVALVGLRTLLAPEDREPEPMPACMTCGQRFLDARGVDWHRHACHPHVDPLTFDEGSITRWNR